MKFHWGHGILSFIILFLILVAIFVVFSLSQSNDLVKENYYEDGANYSQQMEIDQRSLIYQDSIVIESDQDQVSIRLAPSLQTSITALNVFFYRPSNKDQDFNIQVPRDSFPCAIDRDHFEYGRYKAIFSWIDQGEEYIISKTLDVK